MSVKRQKYTKEFISEAIKLVTEHGYSQAEVSKSLGINSRNLNRWILQASGSYKNESTNRQHVAVLAQEELERLRIEVKRLKLEREILKKAATFFANESH